MDENAKILRGSIDGEKKYCRIPIRRRRASRELAEQFVSDSLESLEDLLAENKNDDAATQEINEAISVMLYISDLMRQTEPPEEDENGRT